MIASIADVVEQAAEVAAQLAHRDNLRHWLMYKIVYTAGIEDEVNETEYSKSG